MSIDRKFNYFLFVAGKEKECRAQVGSIWFCDRCTIEKYNTKTAFNMHNNIPFNVNQVYFAQKYSYNESQQQQPGGNNRKKEKKVPRIL